MLTLFGNRRNRRGELLYSLRFPKNKKGEFTVQPVRDAATLHYISRLMRELTEQTVVDPTSAHELWKQVKEPSTLSSACERPALHDAVELHTSRFLK